MSHIITYRRLGSSLALLTALLLAPTVHGESLEEKTLADMAQLRSSGKYQEAIQTGREAITQGCQSISASCLNIKRKVLEEIGNIYLNNLKKYALAEQTYTELLQLTPEDEQALKEDSQRQYLQKIYLQLASAQYAQKKARNGLESTKTAYYLYCDEYNTEIETVYLQRLSGAKNDKEIGKVRKYRQLLDEGWALKKQNAGKDCASATNNADTRQKLEMYLCQKQAMANWNKDFLAELTAQLGIHNYTDFYTANVNRWNAVADRTRVFLNQSRPATPKPPQQAETASTGVRVAAFIGDLFRAVATYKVGQAERQAQLNAEYQQQAALEEQRRQEALQQAQLEQQQRQQWQAQQQATIAQQQAQQQAQWAQQRRVQEQQAQQQRQVQEQQQLQNQYADASRAFQQCVTFWYKEYSQLLKHVWVYRNQCNVIFDAHVTCPGGQTGPKMMTPTSNSPYGWYALANCPNAGDLSVQVERVRPAR